MRALALLLVLGAGCHRTVASNGQLVVFDLTDEARGTYVKLYDGTVVPFSWLAATGLRYWDQVGARLRVDTDLVGFSESEVARAQHSQISISHQLDPSIVGTETWDANIQIWVDNMEQNGWNSQGVFTSTVAHEGGHAMGLGHLPDSDMAVMSPDGNMNPALTQYDVDYFYTVTSG